MLLSAYLEIELFGFMAVFARFGAALLVMPGIGESFVSTRARLMLALAITLLASQLDGIAPAAVPSTVGELVLFLFLEVTVGLFLGLIARVLFTALASAGTIIAFHAGLASAMVFDPTSNQQSAVTGALLSMSGMAFLFIADLHHLLIGGLISSYDLFPVGAPLMIADMADTFAQIASKSFSLALQISAPFVLLNTVINVCVGVLARLMPQIQVFFLVLPVQIALSLLVLTVSITGIMLWYFDAFFEETAGLYGPL